MIRLARGCHSSGLIIPSYVRRAKTLLDTNYRHPWTLNELARTTGSSVSHLSAAFTQHLGSPPMSYLRQLRLNQAALLLRNRGLRVGEVAQEVGYRDIFHFSKAFKQAYGQSPSFYIKSA